MSVNLHSMTVRSQTLNVIRSIVIVLVNVLLNLQKFSNIFQKHAGMAIFRKRVFFNDAISDFSLLDLSLEIFFNFSLF
jgi:hypothetical protein